MDEAMKSLMVGVNDDSPESALKVTSPTEEEGMVLDVMNKMFSRFKMGKSEQNIINQQCWAMYKDGIQGLINNLSGDAGVGSGAGSVDVGWVKGDWRHKVHIPKAYENIMTIASYMRAAAFPNSRWMSLEPGNGESRLKASIFSTVMLQELKAAGISEAVNQWVFAGAVTGTSILYFPWKKTVRTRRYKKGYDDTYVSPDGLDVQKTRKTEVRNKEVTVYDNLKFKVADSTNFYLDPGNPDNPNDAPFIYHHRVHISELMEMMKNGDIDRKLTPKEIELLLSQSNDSSFSSTEQSVKGQNTSTENNRDYVWLTELFGDVIINGELRHDQHLIRSGEFLLRNGLSDYWCCNPYHVYRYNAIPGRTYGEGALEPVLRQLALLDLMTNQRLDAMELVVSGIWERLADSFTRKEDLVVAPNAIITVNQTGEVRQIPLDLRAINIAAQDISALEQSIDRSMGIGNYINAGAARGGERVTAEEVKTVQAAGGQRLTGVYMHFEEEGFEPFLMKAAMMYQQFVDEPRIIKLIGADKIQVMKNSMAETGSNVITDQGFTDSPDEEVQMGVGPEDIQGDFRIQARGADILADREKRLSEFTQAVAVNAQFPAGAVHMKDWEITRGLWERSGVDDWSEYIEQDYQTKKAQAQAPGPQDPNNGAPMPQEQDPMANATLGPLAQDPQQLAAVAGAGGLDPAIAALSGQGAPPTGL
jgi:Bacteriophage head to tail connecting protein